MARSWHWGEAGPAFPAAAQQEGVGVWDGEADPCVGASARAGQEGGGTRSLQVMLRNVDFITYTTRCYWRIDAVLGLEALGMVGKGGRKDSSRPWAWEQTQTLVQLGDFIASVPF